MSIFIVGLTVLFLAILGKSAFGLSLVMPLTLAISFQLDARKSFFTAFVGGLVLSLVEGSPLGRESLALLCAAGFLHAYGRRFSSKHWFFFVVFAVLGSLIYLGIAGRRIGFWVVASEALLVVMFLFAVRGIRERLFSDAITLKV
ncbi:MAG: hypothetical protein A2900_05075 [Candidatus Chisholmbacteria bacterium RIFCSPLOWO2_01_FULL_50_28]|uniref:Rod shape-determining protein MreD n=1 Tax=Candidatus Chisholmbacteria bacterium RIFCSPHIGHO2_01_FULL_52_32 TaxID=1797591 RepID=A0A1G1VS28_9BACT|nr:MAG: hypothetical protein A2786_01665 [Candidatus Chisholmbacteria bacterium RIFCSPHIGHO2_01_FULL_52_32]OGY20420.1 MAG: hypothetical protein A2900_05075 [Candidatus Chisholmbacteria bacterium RIFCSPLOWO2_01_FULL_50_28]